MFDKVLFCVVRKPRDGEAYLDLGTLAGAPIYARERAVYNEIDNLNWARANPVIAISKVQIVEVSRT